MRGPVFFKLRGVKVFARRQYLTPKLSVSFFGGGQVHRNAGRNFEAFKGAIKDIVNCNCSSFRHIQIMKLVS